MPPRVGEYGFLGIDSSNYTTSVCVVSETGRILFERRKLLDVAPGDVGLMQSRALFQHTVNLPLLLDALQTERPDLNIQSVAVSSRPRDQVDSYMPVFLPGVVAAQGVATGAGVPLVRTTHQSGHIAAGLATTDVTVEGNLPFLALHLSGGTTDLVTCVRTGADYQVSTVATSRDLHVGQFVDRTGVMLGLPFPAGPWLESLAMSCKEAALPLIPSSVFDGCPSFAGPLSAATRHYEAGETPERIAASVLRVIATTIEKMLEYAWDQTRVHPVLLVGGVARNQIIRDRLRHRLGARYERLAFCEPAYASDNAYGVALIGLDSWRMSAK
ncbi:MAG: O-sialoglycoprotein endopeptidase [Firmicutes bacterium]|nr:O-sialoglycoprotein endopeptidase [Bacillota bacterium]